MAILEDNSEAMLALEALVDQVGTRNVIFALAKIAQGKAEHLKSNWQDYAGAARWTRSASKLEACANKLAMEW